MVKMEHLNPYIFFFCKEQNLSNENTELDPIAYFFYLTIHLT